MSTLVHGEVQVAVVATPSGPVGETGGAEVFTGALANALVEQGFPVRVYGQENPTFGFADGVTYVTTSPSTNEIMHRDGVNLKRAMNETGIATPLRLAMDIAESPRDQRWAIIDNGTITMPLVPLLSERAPHIFIQHSSMTPHAYGIYNRVRACGGRIVAIADHQREAVASQFGPLHDITIKNGIDVRDFAGVQPQLHQRGEPIRVGTLSRIEATDIKGIGFAIDAVAKLREQHDAALTIAGPASNPAAYDAIVAPHLDEHTRYVGAKQGKAKTMYVAGLHVGAALSNPGNWNEEKGAFTASFVEGNSLTLHEMIYGATIPASTDSGGAEPMIDAGLQDFVIPLDVIRKEGRDALIGLVAAKMLRAAYYLSEISALRSKVRTMEDVGRDYGEYIMDLVRRSTGS